jgi:cellulose synthase/poly-beta-1,6-N-acetylglucosamine synthase-like glycosyltransferase
MAVLVTMVVVVALVLTFIATASLWWMMHAWRTPETFESIRSNPNGHTQLSFSVIVPCRQESETVMAETVRRLLAQDHPDFEIIISLGHDDLETIFAAERIASASSQVRLSINHDPIKNKPRQLNSALLDCRKEVVGIIDAESLTAPGLLRRIDMAFQGNFIADGALKDQIAVVQGAVHLVNLRSKWFSLRNCLEYRIWFRSRLHGHADAGFIPLGGNTVFIRRQLLEEIGGWDGDCLAEDCEIGVRLSVLRKRIVCLYAPELITREETPDTVRAFVKQRTRWSLGFMQVMAKGDWKRLPTVAERVRAFVLLGQQYMVAFSGLVLPLAIGSAIIGNLPVVAVLLAFLPLVPTILTLSFEALILHEFGRDVGIRIRVTDYAWLIVSTPLYQTLLAFSSLRALCKFYAGNFYWEKTRHVGAHLESSPIVNQATSSIRARLPAR